MGCAAWSSSSGRERLGIGALHLRTQFFERPELKLLHCALTASELLRDFTNTPLLHKTFNDDPALIRGKLMELANELRTMFDRGHFYERCRLCLIIEIENH